MPTELGKNGKGKKEKINKKDRKKKGGKKGFSSLNKSRRQQIMSP